MSIVGARIDNRLLHGIVATTWVPKSSATRVMVIDDEVANNSMLKETMKLGRPSGLALSIIDESTALNNFLKGKYNNQNVFILSKTPEVFLELVKNGIEIKKINLGGTLAYEDSIKVTNRAFVMNREKELYKELKNYGVVVTSSYSTNDDEVDVFKKIGIGE